MNPTLYSMNPTLYSMNPTLYSMNPTLYSMAISYGRIHATKHTLLTACTFKNTPLAKHFETILRKLPYPSYQIGQKTLF
jgi:hypothetical protein